MIEENLLLQMWAKFLIETGNYQSAALALARWVEQQHAAENERLQKSADAGWRRAQYYMDKFHAVKRDLTKLNVTPEELAYHEQVNEDIAQIFVEVLNK